MNTPASTPFADDVIVLLLENIRIAGGEVVGRNPDEPSDTGFRPLADFLGNRLPSREGGEAATPPFTPAEKANLIADYFYHHFYVFGRTSLGQTVPQLEPSDGENEGPPVSANLLTRPLRRSPDGAVRVAHRTAHLIAPAGLYSLRSENEPVTLFLDNEGQAPGESEGSFRFEWVTGNLPGRGSTVRFVRFYLHLDVNQGAKTARTLKKILDDRGIPFRFKYLVPTSPGEAILLRQDTGVLFVSIDDFCVTFHALRAHYTELNLTEGKPLFVRDFSAMPGLSFAEDPTGSFGKARMRLLATCFVACWEQDARPPEWQPKPGAVLEKICRNGYRLGAFYLEPDSDFPYDEAFFAAGPDDVSPSGGKFLPARIIGDWLCREALWLELNRCNWVATRSDVVRYEFLEEDWPTGRLGIALFLHVLAKCTGYGLYAYVAEGAIGNVAHAVEALPDGESKRALIRLIDWTPASQHLTLEIADGGDHRELPDTAAKEAFAELRQALCQEGKRPDLSILKDEEAYLSTALVLNQWGIRHFVPGLNGLALTGFGLLRRADPGLPPIPQAPEPGP